MSWYKDEIPKEYKKLEYIQSTGTQYIDTGTPLTSNSRIVMDCELTAVSGTQCFFCSRTEATTTDATSNTLFAIGSTYRKEYYGESKTATNSDGANKRIVVDNNKNSIKIGSASLAFSSVDDITSPMNCYLMASTILENGVVGTFSNFAYMKLYSCQIYNNDILLRNFIPCQRKSDSTLGLFDIVGQTFYVNSGTGTFNFKELIAQSKMYIGVESQSSDYIKRLSKTIDKIYFPFNDTIKTVLRGYIGVNNLSKLCFSAGIQLGSLPIGSTIEVPVVVDWQSRFGQSIVFKIADKNHEGYPDNCTTLITDKIIQFMAFDAKEIDSNNMNQRDYGNNRYIYSNLLQWLNSEAIAGEWYKAMHENDNAPINKNVVNYNPYASWAGFLAMLDTKFVKELLLTTVTVTVPLTSYNYETSITKIFLASGDEVGSRLSGAPEEDKLLALFNNDSRRAYPTVECIENGDGYSTYLSTTTSVSWWLRPPSQIRDYETYIINYQGEAITTYSYGVAGVRPLCNLPNNTLLSKEPNANGHYTLL